MLAHLAVGADAARTRDAEITAAKAYDSRLARIASLTAKVARDRRQLALTLA